MAKILCIETATEVCSVCIAKDGKVISLKESAESNSHSVHLNLLIEDASKRSGIELKNLDAVAVSSGPGSYTGLRIGYSTAKGLCYALEIPLIAVSTLQHMAVSAIGFIKNKDALYCPMLDARRKEVYTAIYNYNADTILNPQPLILDESSLRREHYLEHPLVVFGTGAKKAVDILQNHDNIKFYDELVISSSSLVPLAEEAFNKGFFENIAYANPVYLKKVLFFGNNGPI